MSDDALKAKLTAPDTGPLITLAAADSLDYPQHQEQARKRRAEARR